MKNKRVQEHWGNYLLAPLQKTTTKSSAHVPSFLLCAGRHDQLFYLVLFSYRFFLQGVTGLTIAIGSVVTLAVLMRVTAHLDWNEIFKIPKKEEKWSTPKPTPPPLKPAEKS